jgi:hypothetical protein
MDKQTVLSYYRHFVRYGLRAVSYNVPQRYIYMDILRKRFRSNCNEVDMTRMENTKRFILNAALYTGMESRMLYTMIHVAYGRKTLWPKMIAAEAAKSRPSKRQDYEQYQRVYQSYDLVVDNLNNSMNLCL